MRTERKSKVLSIILLIAIVFTTIFSSYTPVYADKPTPPSTPAPIKQTYQIGNVNYYQVPQDSPDEFDNGQVSFLRHCLTSPILDSEGQEYTYLNSAEERKTVSMMNCYDWLAARTRVDYHAAEVSNNLISMEQEMVEASINNPDETLITQFYDKNVRPVASYKKAKYLMGKSSLLHANSFEQAPRIIFEAMSKFQRDLPNSFFSTITPEQIAEGITVDEGFPDDSTQQPIFMTVTGYSYVEDGVSLENMLCAKEALVTLFYDFKVTPLLPDHKADANNYVRYTQTPEDGNGIVTASGVRNGTGETVRADQSISNSTTVSLTSEINGSESYGFEESISVGMEVDGLFAKATTEIGFTASQSISKGWSESKGETKERTEAFSLGMDLPPYTSVMMRQQNGSTTTYTYYNCPVSVDCKVMVYSLSRGKDFKYTAKKLASFDSRKELTTRAVANYSATDKDNLKWMKIFNPAVDNGARDIMNGILYHAPMGSTDAAFTEKINTVNSAVEGIKALYPLNIVKTADNTREYEMTVGDGTYLEDIGLQGLNSYNGSYYGFNPNSGSWKIVDEDGNEITDDTVAVIEQTATGFSKLKAVGPGTVYLKYFIPEETYDSAEAIGEYATTDSLAKTAMIEVNVKEEPFEGSIEVTGEFTGCAGDDFTSFTGENGLSAVVLDATDREVDRMVTWEAKELKGIEIEGGSVKFSKPGTYKVRAVSGKIFSGWVEIYAEEARKLDDIVLADNGDPAVLSTFKLNDGSNTVDLSKLTVSAFDQYDADWTIDSSELTWLVNGEELTGSELTVTEDGVYTIAACADDVTSNELTLEVLPAPELAKIEISGDFTKNGLGVGKGYAVDLSKEIKITAVDQYEDPYDYSADKLEWIADGRYSSVDGNLLKGNAAGTGSLTLSITGLGSEPIVSNALNYNVFVKPYVYELYSHDGGTIREGEDFDLSKVTMIAKDQNGDIYPMSESEINSITWKLTDKGTIKSTAGASLDGAAGTLTVAKGTLGYGKTGSVVVSATFVNRNEVVTKGDVTISVKQAPILDQLALALKESDSVKTEQVKYCLDLFAVNGADQYGAEFDLSKVPLTFTSSNQTAFTIQNASANDKIIIKAGGPNATSQITVSATNELGEKVKSNEVTLRVPRVRRLEALRFTNAPTVLPREKEVEMSSLNARCYDDKNEVFTEEDLAAYPTKINYSLDAEQTDAKLDTEKNLLSTGTVRGYLTVSAYASKQKEGTEVKHSVRIWIGPAIEKMTASKTFFHAKGGDVKIDFTGSALENGIEVQLLDQNKALIASADTTGDEKKQSATITVPDNKTTGKMAYTIAYTVCGVKDGDDEYAPAANTTVTVENHALTKNNYIAPTCTKAGQKEHWHCAICKERYEDINATKAITKEGCVIAAKGHRYGAWIVTKEATAKKAGSKKRVCQHDAKHVETKVIPALTSGTPIAKLVSSGKTGMKLTWSKVKGAQGYEVYFARCEGKDSSFKKVRTVKAGQKLQWSVSNLKTKTAYKAYVRPYVVKNGKKLYGFTAPVAHGFSSNGTSRYTNAKSITVKAPNVVIKAGKSSKIKATVNKANKRKALMPKSHVGKLRYMSTNPSVATVDSAGKIKGVKKGSCTIYVYAHNGVSTAVKVTIN